MSQTDGHVEAYRLFSRLCERACKYLFSQQNSSSGFCNEVAVHFPRRVRYILKIIQLNFRIQKVNWLWWAITKLLTVNEHVIFFLRNWYWRPASHFMTASKVVELHAVFQRPNLFVMQKCLKINFVLEAYFMVYKLCQKYWIPITNKLNLLVWLITRQALTTYWSAKWLLNVFLAP